MREINSHCSAPLPVNLRCPNHQEQITAWQSALPFYQRELLNCMFHNIGDYPVYKCCIRFVILKCAFVVSARIWELGSVFPWRPHQDPVLGTQIRCLLWAESDSNLQSSRLREALGHTFPLRLWATNLSTQVVGVGCKFKNRDRAPTIFRHCVDSGDSKVTETWLLLFSSVQI